MSLKHAKIIYLWAYTSLTSLQHVTPISYQKWYFTVHDNYYYLNKFYTLIFYMVGDVGHERDAGCSQIQ